MDREFFERRLQKIADRTDKFFSECGVPGSWKGYRRILPPPLSKDEAAKAPPVLIPYLTTVSSCLVFGAYEVDYKPPFTETLSDGIVLKLCAIGFEGCEYWLHLIVESDSPHFKVGSIWNTGGCNWYEKYSSFDKCVEETIKEVRLES